MNVETLENETYSVKIILTIAHLDHDPGNSCLIKAWRSTSDFPRAPSRIAWPCKSSSINSACFGFTGYKTLKQIALVTALHRRSVLGHERRHDVA